MSFSETENPGTTHHHRVESDTMKANFGTIDDAEAQFVQRTVKLVGRGWQ